MSTFNLAVVFLTIGVVVVACLSGICSVIFGKRKR